MKTISLQGKVYAPVKERLKAFHADNKNPSILTSYRVLEGKTVVFDAIVIPNVEQMNIKYTGHSMGVLGKQKAFEKLESISVGRALAFAGYSADGEIATYEEMESIDVSEDIPLASQGQKDMMYELLRTSTFSEEQKQRFEDEIESITVDRASLAISHFKEHQKDVIAHNAGRGKMGELGKAVLDAVNDPRK